MSKITVLVKEVGKDLRLERIEPTFDNIEKLIDCSWLDFLPCRADGVVMVVDGEGFSNNKRFNFRFGHGKQIFGTAVFYGFDMFGNFVSLTAEQIEIIETELDLREILSTPFAQVKIVIK